MEKGENTAFLCDLANSQNQETSCDKVRQSGTPQLGRRKRRYLLFLSTCDGAASGQISPEIQTEKMKEST